jgi:hypothetical protein
MKTFLANNWYKMAIASSLLISSIAFLLFSAGRSFADPNKYEKSSKVDNMSWRYEVVANASGIYVVRFDEGSLWSSTAYKVTDIR